MAERILGIFLALCGLALTFLMAGLGELAIRQEIVPPWETWGGFLASITLGAIGVVGGLSIIVAGIRIALDRAAMTAAQALLTGCIGTLFISALILAPIWFFAGRGS